MNPSRSSQPRGGRSRGRSLDYGNEAPTYHQLSSHPQQHQRPTQYSHQQFPQQNQYETQHPTHYSNAHPPQYSNPRPTQYSNQHPTQYSNPHPTQYENPHPTHYSPHPTHYENPYTEPFTQYDTHTRSPQTPEHNPIPVEEDDEAEPEGDGGKGRPYTIEEERCLARAYVRGTDNAEHGRDQKSAKYWKDIEKEYNEDGGPKNLPFRDWKSLKNKMTRVKYEVVRWFTAVAFVESARGGGSGWNEVIKMEKINAKFQSLNKRYKNAPFKFLHMVESLSKCSKFHFITTGSAQLLEETNSSPVDGETPRLSVNASNESVGEFHSGDKRSRYCVDEVNSPPHPERPIGNKAAKRLAKGKGKLGEGSSEVNREAIRLDRALFLQEDLEFQKQAHSDKMKVIERAVLVEEKKTKVEIRKARTEERKAKIEEARVEREQEMQIMTMDISYMAPDQQTSIYEMRKAILAKWKIPK